MNSRRIRSMGGADSAPPPAPRLAVISAADWDSIVSKGVVSLLHDFEEGGYFETITSIFPFAPRSLTIQLSERQRVVQFGYERIPGGARYRWVRFALAPLLVFRLVLAIRSLIRTEGVNIVRATDPYWCGLLGWLATLGTTAAFCVSIHSDWDQRHRLDRKYGAPKLLGSRVLAKLVERFVLRRALLVLCIRTSLIEYAVASGASRAKTRFIPHGVDLTLFGGDLEEVREKFGLPAAARLVVFVGRLARENYVFDMLEVARALSDIPDLRVVLIGGGVEEQAVRTFVAADPKLAARVVMTGFVPRETAIAFRRAATVNIVPMGGYSLIEACASGRPVVSFDVEWHADLIENGKTGFLVAENDVEAFARSVRHLCADAALAARIGAAGQVKARKLHDITAVRKRKIACYDELLA